DPGHGPDPRRRAGRRGEGEGPGREHARDPQGATRMIADVNAYLGSFAFRRLRHNTAASLLRPMDAKGIDLAVVSSAAAITYRNTQDGNEEVAEEVKAHRDRLVPFAVINPSYAGWKDDLAECHEQWGMTGLRLYPRWHN